LLEEISQRTEAISEEVLAAAAAVVDVPHLATWLDQQATDQTLRDFWLDVGAKLLIIFGLAFAAEWLVRWVLRRARRVVNGAHDQLLVRIWSLAARALLAALPILTFAGVAYLILPLTGARFATARFATTLISAYVAARLIAAVARVILLPRFGASMLRAFSEETRGYLYIWTKRFTYWAVFGYAVAAGAW